MIYPPSRKVSTLGESFIGLSDTVDMEHKRLLARKSLIEKRKEEHERHMLEMVVDYLSLIFITFNFFVFYSFLT